jgi:alkanesulfonate monooxygenase SsuD/methylene tetrahydromethanopterin reductase-like flavin-dependent oxidoreductase (luciferase family)
MWPIPRQSPLCSNRSCRAASARHIEDPDKSLHELSLDAIDKPRDDSAMPAIRFGANFWNQCTSWQALLEAGIRADRLGYDTLWTWHHLYPIVGDSSGYNFEGWLTITAWAARTERIRMGLLVGANPYREPTLVAKMATALDHISNGRAIIGIGAAWNEEEAAAFGFAFGSGAPERLRWLGEALPVMRGMLDGDEPSATGPRYRARQTRNLPPPVQKHLPILIGGMGERVTLRLAARYADMNNLGGDDFEQIRRSELALVAHCEEVGRDPAEIERTASIGTILHSRRSR